MSSLLSLEVQGDFWDTIAALGAAGVYTGEWQRIRYIARAAVSETPDSSPWAHYVNGLVFADQAGTLFVEQSNDGATVQFQENFPIAAGWAGGVGFNRRIFGAWVRVRYVNGAVAQTAFSLFALVTGPQ